MGGRAAIPPEVPRMTVHKPRRAGRPRLPFPTPRGSVRHRLPWSWSSFDYPTLCRELWAQCDARFEIAKVEGRRERRDVALRSKSAETAPGDIAVTTDRGTLTAPLVVDALGWRRVLGAGPVVQPPQAPISRGLEVHPDGSATDLDIWIERSLVRYGYAWSVPAADHVRVGGGPDEPRHHVKEPTQRIADRLGVDAVRYQGNWFPHRLRPATEAGVFFAGDSAGHCFPLSGEGIRTAFYFGIACGRELRAVLAGARTREQALERYGAFSASHARAFRLAFALQWAIPRLPPRALTALLAVMGRERPTRRAYGWYLDQAHPRALATIPRPWTLPTTSADSFPASSRTGARARC